MAIVSLTAMSQESAVGIYVQPVTGLAESVRRSGRPPRSTAVIEPPADGLDNTSAVVTSGFIAEHPYRIHRCAQWCPYRRPWWLS